MRRSLERRAAVPFLRTRKVYAVRMGTPHKIRQHDHAPPHPLLQYLHNGSEMFPDWSCHHVCLSLRARGPDAIASCSV